MTKEQANDITKKIKAYYYYFELDKFSLKIWIEKLLPYSYEDVDRKVEEHIKGEDRQNPPRVQDLIKDIYTEEEKEKNTGNYTIECNLCHRWMTYEDYEAHYDKCLDISYLVDVAKQKGESFTRQDLENCRDGVIERMIEKYPPKKIAMENLGNLFK